MADSSRYRDDPSIEDAQHDGDGSPLNPSPTANSFFRRPLKIITWITLVLIVAIIGLTITNCVLLGVWNFERNSYQLDVNRTLAIVLFATAILSIPTLFVNVPIIITLIVHSILAGHVVAFSVEFFKWSFPSSEKMCRYYIPDNSKPYGGHMSEPTQYCIEKVEIMQILMSVAGGVGIFIGVLVIAMTLLRFIAILKTKFWKNKRITRMFSLGSFNNFTGVTVQLSFSILPSGTLPVVVDTQSSRVIGTTGESEAERLIET